MGKILNAFFNDDLDVNSMIQSKDSKYRRLSGHSYELQEKLQSILNEKENTLLSELIDALSDESYYYAHQQFIKGYELGVLMTSEIYADKEVLLENVKE